MRFGLLPEQVQQQASLERLLAARSGLSLVRRHAAGETDPAAALWTGLSEMGLPGLAAGEAFGGSALSWVDAALASEGLGRHIAPAPFVETCLAVEALQRFGSEAQTSRWLPGLASGEIEAGLALSEQAGGREDAGLTVAEGRVSGRALFVLNPEAALLVAADREGRLYLVDGAAPGLRRVRLETIDATRDVAEIWFDRVPAEPLPVGSEPRAAQRLLDVGRVLFAADTLGAAQRMLEQAVAYAGQREQFGRPIASFQAVKHMCAEMAAALEPCRAMVWYAAHALDALPGEASRMARHAKAHVSEVGTFVARTATEVHGGMGFTDLLGLHFWFKRIGFNRQILGGPQAVRAEAARLRGL
jgi:alkylation response protein AidB-like acyl-CoA dehydrogenase